MTTAEFLTMKMDECINAKRLYKDSDNAFEQVLYKQLESDIEFYIDAIATVKVFNQEIA